MSSTEEKDKRTWATEGSRGYSPEKDKRTWTESIPLEGLPRSRSSTPPPREGEVPRSPRSSTPPPGRATAPPTRGGTSEWRWNRSSCDTEKLRGLFQMIDNDCSAEISTTELRHMLINLGEDVSDQLVSDMLTVVDANRDKNIDFDEFVNVMTGATKMADVKHSPARFERFNVLDKAGQDRLEKKLSGPEDVSSYSNEEMRHLFNKMDIDESNTLDKHELMELAQMMGKAVKPRDMVDVMKYMDPGRTGEVSFPMFRSWLLDTNLHWTSLLVLPEGTVAAIRQKARTQLNELPVDQDPAKTEWMRLSILLKAMGDTVDLWGNPADMYGQHIIQLEHDIGELMATKNSDANGPSEQQTVSPRQRIEHVNAEIGKLQEQLRKIAPNSKLCEQLDKESSWSVLNYAEVDREVMARRCFVHPNQSFRVVWDMVQVVLLLYLLISLPLRMSFELEVEFNSFAFWFDAAVDVYFWLDIAVNFRTPYYNSRGVLIIDEKKIAVAYLKGWFLVDLATCLPISYVLMAMHGVESAGEGKQVRLFKILRLLRLAKLLRVTRLMRILERYRVQLRPVLQATGGFLLALGIVLCTHIYACVWHYVGTIDQPATIDGVYRTPGYHGWVYREYGPSCKDDGDHALDMADHWSSEEDMEKVINDTSCSVTSDVSRYMTSMYWALMTISTVGYGDYTAQTDLEKVWSMCTMLFGALVFATITGVLSARMTATRGSIQHYNTKLEQMREFCASNALPHALTRTIELHYVEMYKEKCIYSEKDILGELPWTIIKPVLRYLYDDTMLSTALFTQLVTAHHGREIITDISLQLRREYGVPGFVLVEQGHFGDSMYFIKQGEVEIYQRFAESGRLLASGEDGFTKESMKESQHDPLERRGKRLGRLGVRSFFGELGVMRVAGRRMDTGSAKSVRSRTVVAKTDCVLLVLHKSDLDKLREQYDHLEQAMANLEKGLSAFESTTVPRSGGAMDVAARNRDIDMGGAKMDLEAIDELICAKMATMERDIDAKMAKMKSDMDAKLDACTSQILAGIARLELSSTKVE